jgi:hypothetical protein
MKSVEVSVDFYRPYRRFADLPDYCKNASGASLWFRAMVVWSGQIFSPHFFEQIPLEFMTDGIRRYAISCDVRALQLIDPDDTTKYASLCQLGYQTHFNAVRYFHESACTQDTIDAMLTEPGNFFQCYKTFPWIAQVMTPAMIEKVSMASLDFMLTLPDDQITVAALKKHLGQGYYAYTILRIYGRLHLGVNYLKGGSWPDPLASLEACQVKPDSIEQALSFILSDDKKGAHELYMAYVMIHPIEDVIEHVVSPALAEIVLEMYDEDVLRPHLKNNRHLKAALLEESLGL